MQSTKYLWCSVDKSCPAALFLPAPPSKGYGKDNCKVEDDEDEDFMEMVMIMQKVMM